MTLAEALHSIAAHPEDAPTPEVVAALRDAAAQYPFCAIPQALLLRFGLVDEASLDTVRAHVAVLTADKQALASVASMPADDPSTFYPPTPRTEPVGTESAIDTFLSTYGQTTPEEEALLERMIFNPVPDYAEVLEAEGPASAPAELQGQDAVIDAFLRRDDAQPAPATPEETPQAPAPTPTPASGDNADTSLSESLARIFIARGSYGRALEIISDLAARYPDKNPFYADQIRYLRKLVALQSLASH
ncbi:MAG: hypothetical protein K2M12_06655 [Muribaculaceae bacterium]|nr:hypothetical protein [Muribaculaceae bacterium]